MKYLTKKSSAIIILLLSFGCGLPALSYENARGDNPVHYHEAEEERRYKVMGAKEAALFDAKIIAENKGWEVNATLRHMQTQAQFSSLLDKVAELYPNKLSSAEFAPKPGGNSSVNIKGEVPDSLFNLIDSSGLDVVLNGGRKFSRRELRERSLAILKYLSQLGYTSATSAVRPNGSIEVGVGATATVQDEPVLPYYLGENVKIAVAKGNLTNVEHARGGARVSGSGSCTSGWAVTNGSVTGVSTAAHCFGINWYINPPSELEADFNLVHEAEHLGLYGDVEWKTAPSHIEPAEFFATSSQIREVNSVETSFAVNATYCVYGRSSNNRQCDNVYSTWVNALDGLTLISGLVGMDNDNTLQGDSGGGWSFSTEAAGGHRGDQWIWFKMRNVFSRASLFPSALGVSVRTQ